MTPEAKTKKAVCKTLDAAGIWYFLPVSAGYGRAGIPDIICCAYGLFLAIECKAGRGKTTALQDRELSRIAAAGGCTVVVYDSEDDYRGLTILLESIKLKMQQ